MFYSRLATPLCHLFLWSLFSFTHNIEFAEPGNYHIVKISLISSNIYYAMCSWIAWTCEEKNIVLRHSFVFKINKLKNKLCYFIFCKVRTEIITTFVLQSFLLNFINSYKETKYLHYGGRMVSGAFVLSAVDCCTISRLGSKHPCICPYTWQYISEGKAAKVTIPLSTMES